MFKTLFLTISLLMASNTMADAALLTVYPTGNSSYIVYGSALEGVVGIDLTITYDLPYLQNPTVSKGALVASAMEFLVVTSNPGEIRALFITLKELAFSGSGRIIAIQFAPGTGSIMSLTAKLVGSTDDFESVPLPVSVTIADSGLCANSSIVTIADVQSAINMFLGIKAVEICVDTDYNGAVSIAEVQKAINGFLGL